MRIVVTDKFRTFTALALIPLIIAIGGWACNVQSVVQRVDSILAEVGPALQIIVSLLPLLTGKQIPTNVVTQINAWIPKVESDTTTLQSVITQYQSTLATDVTAQAKINDAIRLAEQDITSILPVFQVLDPATQQKITAIVTAVGAAVLSVETIINTAEGKASVSRKAAPFVSNGKDFKAKFNSALHAPTGDATVDGATAKLSL